MIIIGIDLGERRVGFAVCNTEIPIATPLKTVSVRSKEQALQAVIDVAAEVAADKLVLGYPIDMSGKRGKKATEAKGFSQELTAKGFECALWDERLTSTEAHNAMKRDKKSRKQRMNYVDEIAAQLILQSYIDATGSR